MFQEARVLIILYKEYYRKNIANNNIERVKTRKLDKIAFKRI